MNSLKTLAVVILASLSVSQVIAQTETTTPLLQQGKKSLYQRVLTTPTCLLTDKAGATGGKSLPAFSRLYVYERDEVNGQKWLRVGADSFGKIIGWIPATCAVDWKAQLTLAINNPAARNPLLFFKDKESLEKIIDTEKPAELVNPILQNLNTKGSDPAIISREPEKPIDIEKNFYLLPILAAEDAMTGTGTQTMLLNVAAIPQKNAPTANGQSASPATGSAQNNQKPSAEQMLKEFTAGVMFVNDSTISMGPFLTRTKQAASQIFKKFENTPLAGKVKFGVLGYRSDGTDKVKGIEYVSKMFVNPNEVTNSKDFLDKVKNLKEAKQSTLGWSDDAYAGVLDAIRNVNWNDFGARYIVLVTDASAIDADDPRSTTKLNAEQIRQEAERQGIAIYVLHLETPGGKKNKDFERATAQYRELSFNKTLNASLYYPVPAQDDKEFAKRITTLASALSNQVQQARKGIAAAGSALNADHPDDTAKPTSPSENTMLEDSAKLGHAMVLAWLGEKTSQKMPELLTSWISDRDLIDRIHPTVDVRILLTKAELDNMSQIVKNIYEAANTGLISPEGMFEQLRSVAATMGRNPDQLQGKKTLAQMGLMEEYLEGLPYKSEALNIDEDTWKSMTVVDQEKFIRRLYAKLNYYQKVNEDVDRWISLTPGTASDKRNDVYPLLLENLP